MRHFLKNILSSVTYYCTQTVKLIQPKDITYYNLTILINQKYLIEWFELRSRKTYV